MQSAVRALYHVVLWLVAIAFFLPVLWIFLDAFKSPSQILAVPPRWIFRPTLSGLVDTIHHGPFWHYLANSLLLSIGAVLIALLVSFLAAYSFSRFRNRATDFLMFLLLSIRMVPGAAVIVPIYMMYSAFGWLNTESGMLLFYAMFSIPFSVWILKGFIDGVSKRFDEGARVDGASVWHIMGRVILPQVVPGLLAAFIFNIIFVWNEFLVDFMVGGSSAETVPVALAGGLYTSQGIDWQYIAGLSFIYTLPLVIVVYLFQRYLLVGMTFGTVRGEI